MFNCSVCQAAIAARNEPINTDTDYAFHNKTQLRYPFQKIQPIIKDGKVYGRKLAPSSNYWNPSIREIYCSAECALARTLQLTRAV